MGCTNELVVQETKRVKYLLIIRYVADFTSIFHIECVIRGSSEIDIVDPICFLVIICHDDTSNNSIGENVLKSNHKRLNFQKSTN